MPQLDDKVAIVTGGAQGIGAAYCRRFADEGAKVVVADIDAKLAEATADELRGAGAEAVSFVADVSDESAVQGMVDAAIESFGRVDVLINNAAIYQRPAVRRVPLEELSVEEWDRVMEVNLRGVFLCSRAVIPHMKEQKSGKIVNISSSTVHSGVPRFAHYVTSKAGVMGLTRVMAKELGDWNINVNAVAPGLILSIEDADGEMIEQQQQRSQSRAFKRIETPADVVGAVLFLCSADSDFMTGQTLVVDGGVSFS
ncbi:MAG: 3-oxoacyl-ACP reductase family protein [Dehalococcoidia bacterium]